MKLIGLISITLSLIITSTAYSEGRLYTPDESKSHCTLWDTNPLRWPQTILGLEPMNCRRKAVPPTTNNTITCRLKRQYIDPESKERMCIYERGGTGQGELTVSMDSYFQCPRTQQCTQERNCENRQC